MMLRIANHGLWQLHSSQRGHLLVKIAVTVPRNLTVEQLDLIKQIKNTQ
jgi:DnaJ-class molecular chaperone